MVFDYNSFMSELIPPGNDLNRFSKAPMSDEQPHWTGPNEFEGFNPLQRQPSWEILQTEIDPKQILEVQNLFRIKLTDSESPISEATIEQSGILLKIQTQLNKIYALLDQDALENALLRGPGDSESSPTSGSDLDIDINLGSDNPSGILGQNLRLEDLPDLPTSSPSDTDQLHTLQSDIASELGWLDTALKPEEWLDLIDGAYAYFANEYYLGIAGFEDFQEDNNIESLVGNGHNLDFPLSSMDDFLEEDTAIAIFREKVIKPLISSHGGSFDEAVATDAEISLGLTFNQFKEEYFAHKKNSPLN